MYYFLLLLKLALVFIVVSCDDASVDGGGGAPIFVSPIDTTAINSDTTLFASFEQDFLVGVALSANQTSHGVDGKIESLIETQFNSIVNENCLKPIYIQPQQGKFNFTDADKYIQFGEAYDKKIIGHTLVWHSQVPDWMFVDNQGQQVDRTELLSRMKSHITTTVGRYKGKVHGWDVVNEAIDGGSWRKSKWYTIIGPDFIDSAFHYAAQADPNVELYYNDYSMNSSSKRARVVELVNRLKSAGIRIDAVGMQAHYSLGVNLNEIEQSIQAFANAGVNVMFTELDVSVLPWPPGVDPNSAEIGNDAAYDEKYNPYPNALPESVQIQLAETYKGLFELFCKHSDKITRVTFWGLNDGMSWKNNFPVKGRTDYPLLFDRNNDPKLAYEYVVNIKK